jgi:glycosyltransferase involved in cell wall biosynthesis
MVDPNKEDESVILHLTPFMEKAGIDRGVLNTCKYLISQGFRSIVISGGGSLITALTKLKVQHVNLYDAKSSISQIWRNTNKIQKIIQTNPVKLIHAHSRSFAWSIFWTQKRLKNSIPWVTTFHAIYKNESRIKKFYNSIMTRGNKVITVSNFSREHLIKEYNIAPNDIKVIYRGVDTELFNKNDVSLEEITRLKTKYNAAKNIPIILLPAKFTSWKGHLLLIEALTLIKDLNFYCIMVGSLSLYPKFVELVLKKIKDAKLQSKIQVFGLDEELKNLYALSDIVLSTSTEPEGFSRIIIEAQSMEKLVVAANIGSTEEIIQDQINGLLCEANNAQDLSEKIKYALSILNSPKAETITSNARESVTEKFSLPKIQSQLIEFYEELIDQKTKQKIDAGD